MGLGSFIKKQFIDVIEWPNPEDDVLVWRFPAIDQEIQTGAQLTVRESQMALFVDEGKVADVFEPGMYTLDTKTLPVLTSLKNWDKLFQSPFKSDIYFFNTKVQLGRKWGTAQPITIRDKEFGIVSVRAFGMFSYRVVDPKHFFLEVSGVGQTYTGASMEGQLRNLVMSTMATLFGQSDIPFIDMAANQTALSQQMAEALRPAFERYGLELDNFAVESITLPEALQKTLDERISMGIVGDMSRYMQYQTASSIPLAAQNEGGVAGVGASMAAGMAMGQAMSAGMAGSMTNMAGNATAQATTQSGAAAEPPEAKLAKLKDLLDKGLITQQDYDAAKVEVIKQLTR